MYTRDLQEFKSAFLGRGRLLGLDPGSKTIGMAMSDSGWRIASPLETIKRTQFKHDIVKLLYTLTSHSITGLVVGYPVNMDGSEGPRCQSIRQFVRSMEAHLSPPLPILLWDERMSSQAVERTMLEADLSRQRRGELVDKLAASYILQGVLDALENSP
jgi:putative holliday junction resolvase